MSHPRAAPQRGPALPHRRRRQLRAWPRPPSRRHGQRHGTGTGRGPGSRARALTPPPSTCGRAEAAGARSGVMTSSGAPETAWARRAAGSGSAFPPRCRPVCPAQGPRRSPRPAPPLPRRARPRRLVPPEGRLLPPPPAGARGSAGSPSRRGRDGRGAAPARAGLGGAALAAAAARRGPFRAGTVPEVSAAGLGRAARSCRRRRRWESPVLAAPVACGGTWERAGEGLGRAGDTAESRVPSAGPGRAAAPAVRAAPRSEYGRRLELTCSLFVGSLLDIFVSFKENTCLLEQPGCSLPSVLRRAGKFFHNLMEKKDFEAWLDNISITFLSLTDLQKNETLDHLISLSGAVQLRHLSNNLEILLKRDFLKLLPLELSFYLLKWLDPQTLLTCCLVSKQWNKVISACTEVWQTACKNLGWQIDDSVQDPLHWKKVYLKAILRMKQLKDHEAFETSSLIGHSARVYALYYKDGLLCTGSDDLSAKLWDVSTGQCIYGIQTHTCAAVKFDEQKLVTGSFDNTVACWEWSSGSKTQHFRGHTGAVFSVDYNDDLDILVSGSADFTVKVWALSTGTCLNTLTGHTEWVTKVVLQKCKVKSLMHSPGDYILLSADKYEIKIWPIGREINCKCLKTLSVSEDRSISLQPRLHFDGKYIVCSSALGLYQWDFASYDILRVIKPPDFSNVSLLGFGEIFALLFDNRYLYIMDLRTEKLISRWPLPEYRKSKRGSSFLAGEMSWLNGLNGQNDMGLVFATSMPDHSIHMVLWKEHG